MLGIMRYDTKKEIVYGSPADTVFLLMAPARGATLINETDTAWTWDGKGVVQIVPKKCYIQLNADEVIALEYDSMFPLGGIPDFYVVYMKIDEYRMRQITTLPATPTSGFLFSGE